MHNKQTELKSLSCDELMCMTVQHQQEAFSELLTRNERWARTFAARVIGDFHMSEDIVQEAFLRIWNKSSGWTPKTSFRAWFTTILVRLCIDYKRKKRQISVEKFHDHSISAPNAFEKMIIREKHDIVAHLIMQLNTRQRLAILLVYAEGHKTMAAARIMNMHLKAFESLLLRSRRQLNQWYKDYNM